MAFQEKILTQEDRIKKKSGQITLMLFRSFPELRNNGVIIYQLYPQTLYCKVCRAPQM
jgi:hypothetical protein